MSQTREWIFGFHAIEAALKEGNILRVVVDHKRNDQRTQQLLDAIAKADVRVEKSDQQGIDTLLESRDLRHQGVIAEVMVKSAGNEHDLYDLLAGLDHPPFLLILDEVQDPHNVGACLRSAEAFGVDAVIVPKDNSCGLTPVVRKVSSGSSERIPFIEVTNLARCLEQLKERGIWFSGLAGGGEATIYNADLRGPIGIIMGSEGTGLRRLTERACDFIIKIPMEGEIESLNVSVATGVTLAEAYRQRKQLS